MFSNKACDPVRTGLCDSSRKALDTINWFRNEYPEIKEWRKSNNWFTSIKNLSRVVGRASVSGGKGKEKRLKDITKQYLTKATSFRDKLEKSKDELPAGEIKDIIKIMELERFIGLMDKHINLVERRIIKGEKIPHEEKLFSIFEEYSEWITKGKLRPNVELGKKLSITTDQYGLIIDYHIMENESDSQIVLPTAVRILAKYKIDSWSFDKGYYHKDNKWLLGTEIEKVIMPKKGKRNKQETDEEHAQSFKRSRNKHSAVEPNINELEHSGLDRCPDKGYHGFKRYIGIAVIAYNLQKIGKQLIKQELEKQKKNKRRRLKLVA